MLRARRALSLDVFGWFTSNRGVRVRFVTRVERRVFGELTVCREITKQKVVSAEVIELDVPSTTPDDC